MYTQKWHISSALVLGLLTLVGVLTLLQVQTVSSSASALGTTRYVASTGGDSDNDCANGNTPCKTVQRAVDQAESGDTIRVAAGAYADVNSYGGLAQVVYITKSLTIRGGYTTSDWSTSDPEVHTTTLDANGGGRVVYISGDVADGATDGVTVTLEGLHLTGGDATDLGGDPWGNAGGGVYVLSAVVTMSQDLISDNTAPANEFFDDGVGGGVYADRSVLTLRHNRILNNVAPAGSGFLAGSGSGGGLFLLESQLTLEGNLILGNQARGDWGIGGGAVLYACDDFMLVNNVIADNQADMSGSGLEFDHMSGVPSTGSMFHTTIARNHSGTGTEGVRVAGGSVITMVNTIIADHDTGINVSFGSTATLTATLWVDNIVDWGDVGDIFTGTLNFGGDPAFLEPDAGDYHIAVSSAAKDKGVDAGVGTDLDGSPRDASPDLGAYEASAQGVLQVIKTASASHLNPGSTVTYTVVVTNFGSPTMTSVLLTDTLPLLQQPHTATSDLGSCAIVDAGYGGQVTCDVGTLGPDQAAHIAIAAQVTTTLPVSLPQTMRNTVQATSNQSHGAAHADTVLQNCHARVGGALPEYTTVQAAVDAASPGDEVWIAGTCLGAFERVGGTQQVYVDKNLTLRGGYSSGFTAWDPDVYPTILDAGGQGRVIHIEGPFANITIEGLQVTGGDATGQNGTFLGLGDAGGGIYVLSATVTLSRTQVVGNIASSITDGYGGGVGALGGSLTLIETTLADNVASGASFGTGYGGGLSAEFATVQLQRSRLENNVASPLLIGVGQGGGAFLYESELKANATVWLSNSVAGLGWVEGGGLYLIGSAPFTLVNCVLADNQAEDGSGLYADGMSGVLLHPTIARNIGGSGVSVGAMLTTHVAITNAIVFSHEVGIAVTVGSTVTVNGVLWYDNITNTVSTSATIQVSSAFTATPAFDADGYHLTDGSAAIDRGVGAGVTEDIDGDIREGIPDLGADEVGRRCIYLPLVIRNQ